VKYAMSDSEKIYFICIYALCISIDCELNLVNRLDDPINSNVNIINDILNKKFFTNEKLVLYANRILGNYISIKSGLSEEFYLKCIQYEFDIFFGIKLPVVVKETYWVLSNILCDYQNTVNIIFNNELFINKTIDNYKNTVELNVIKEIAYFLYTLIEKCGIENFIRLQEKGIVDITMNHAKRTFNKASPVINIFKLIDALLFIGKSVADNFEGRNLIKEKCEAYGLKELLEKYENSDDSELLEIIERINRSY
jgi:hypothetical protein